MTRPVSPKGKCFAWFLAAVFVSCGGDDGATTVRDPGLDGLALDAVAPNLVVPGSMLILTGESFVDAQWGESTLRLSGDFEGKSVTWELLPSFANYSEMQVELNASVFAQFAGEGEFVGEAVLSVKSAVDEKTYETAPIDVTLEIRNVLTPTLASVPSAGAIFVNDRILVSGENFLLGGAEGQTHAVVDGCFRPEGMVDCQTVISVELPVVPSDRFSRESGSFFFVPKIAGVHPGTFEGQITLKNVQPGSTLASASSAVTYEILPPEIFSISPEAASLGQFVDIEGGGFVGGDIDSITLIELDGQFMPDNAQNPVPVALTLVPEFVEGRLIRYVMNEDDELGQNINLRKITGQFIGEARPIIQYKDQEISGEATNWSLQIAPVKQVVELVFEDAYVESLRHFGLRAMDHYIRERISAVMKRDFESINLETRMQTPADFALYSVVEVHGPDINGGGLFGFDNSPGKDINNQRLYDRIGGVNAVTQQDNSPGYGGVFVESLFAFSLHPGELADVAEGQAAPEFDLIFDPFRPDRGGDPVSSSDLQGDFVAKTSGQGCPATERTEQVACAVFVLGNLIGTTLSHEIGHSLGLANPFGEGFHNPSDEPNRLMDNGSDRSFLERAELSGQGPAIFCAAEYEYLREILPTSQPETTLQRPSCF